MPLQQTTGSRAQVMHGTAKKTSGGLTKSQLKYNKQGKIVSKKASALAKKNNRLVKAGYITRKGKFGVIMKGGAIDVQKYIDAHNGITKHPKYIDAIKELKNDCKKRTHWIWYIFPQAPHHMATSNMSEMYQLKISDVTDYLSNNILKTHYLTIVQQLTKCLQDRLSDYDNGINTLTSIVGEIDTNKVISSLETFRVGIENGTENSTYNDIYIACNTALRLIYGNTTHNSTKYAVNTTNCSEFGTLITSVMNNNITNVTKYLQNEDLGIQYLDIVQKLTNCLLQGKKLNEIVEGDATKVILGLEIFREGTRGNYDEKYSNIFLACDIALELIYRK